MRRRKGDPTDPPCRTRTARPLAGPEPSLHSGRQNRLQGGRAQQARRKREELECPRMPSPIARRALLALAAAVLLQPATAVAQDYPNRPITIVVPLAAGSGMDSLVRLYADKLQPSLGKPVVVENRPGAALMLAAATVAKRARRRLHAAGLDLVGDGDQSGALQEDQLRPGEGFRADLLYVKSPFILVVNPDLPVKTVPDLIKLAKEQQDPADLFVARRRRRAASVDGIHEAALRPRHHPCALQEHAAIDRRHRRGPRRISAFAEAGASLPLIRDGKLRALAVSSKTRMPSLPDVPTFRGSRQRTGFRGRVLAHAVRAGRRRRQRSSSGCMPR